MNRSKKYLPYGKQRITDQDISSVIKVLRSDFITQGDQVKIFESNICSYVTAKYGIAVNSGTSALHIACLALGLGKGDWLWTTPITFVASANCGRYCDANIDFVDINPLTGLISIEELRKKLEKAKKESTLPKVLIVVHHTGTSCEMNSIQKLAVKYNFKVIEDASHALGAKYNSKQIGSCDYSDICVFSFHPVKIITTAEGGMATTNNKELAEKMSLLRSHFITKDSSKFENDNDAPWVYEQQGLGFNFRMNELQAALGISQLKRIDKIVDERNLILERYKKKFNSGLIEFLLINENCISSVHLAVILIKNISNTSYRKIFEMIRSNNIGIQLHYSPVHLQPYYKKYGFKKGDFPNSENYSSRAISLPVFEGFEEEDQNDVIKIVEKAIIDNISKI